MSLTSSILSFSLALMEWQMNKDVQVARNIYELGMSKYSTESGYILEYIKFLSHLNDENSTNFVARRFFTLDRLACII